MYRYELSMTNPLESKSAGVGGWVTCSGSLGLPPSSSSVVVGVETDADAPSPVDSDEDAALSVA